MVIAALFCLGTMTRQADRQADRPVRHRKIHLLLENALDIIFNTNFKKLI